jgi:hypothetical protein
MEKKMKIRNAKSDTLDDILDNIWFMLEQDAVHSNPIAFSL